MLDQAINTLRYPPKNTNITTLSNNERHHVALAHLLLSTPNLLLLNEPTNHLNTESITWLEQHLTNYKSTIVTVTHNQYFLNNVTNWILELDHSHKIPFKNNYSN